LTFVKMKKKTLKEGGKSAQRDDNDERETEREREREGNAARPEPVSITFAIIQGGRRGEGELGRKRRENGWKSRFG